MPKRATVALSVPILLAACAGGPGAPVLGYAVPSPASVTYVVGDTVTIGLEGLGQPMEIGARSAATYGVAFAAGAGGIAVVATVEGLAADVVTPMTEPMAIDQGALEGGFSFVLDPLGHVTSMSSPQASGAGGQVFAAPLVGHTLFPRLPGGSVAVGDSWADSVTYAETADAGETSITSSLTYTVIGEREASGRALLDVAFEGPARLAQNLSIEGATIVQESELELSGRMSWDVAAGLLYSSEVTMEGEGTVRVALLPAELPTRVRWTTRVRLQ